MSLTNLGLASKARLAASNSRELPASAPEPPLVVDNTRSTSETRARPRPLLGKSSREEKEHGMGLLRVTALPLGRA